MQHLCAIVDDPEVAIYGMLSQRLADEVDICRIVLRKEDLGARTSWSHTVYSILMNSDGTLYFIASSRAFGCQG